MQELKTSNIFMFFFFVFFLHMYRFLFFYASIIAAKNEVLNKIKVEVEKKS